MRYPDRRRSRPFDAWDPYRDDPAPRLRNRYQPRRLIRIAFPLLIGGAVLGRDIWRLFEPGNPPPVAQSPSMPVATFTDREPALVANRPEPPDPRAVLPRGAKAADNPGDWITPDDYPPSALRENVTGVVHFRFVIQPDGHVRDCWVTRSSGSVLLDGTACGIFTLHARYWPARDKAGRAVAETGTQTVRWQIPKD